VWGSVPLMVRIGIAQSNSMADTVAVMRLLERHGEGKSRIRTEVIHDRKRNQLERSISANVRHKRGKRQT